jgi:hypothetical protein
MVVIYSFYRHIKYFFCLHGSNGTIPEAYNTLSAYQKHTIPSKSLTIPSKSLTIPSKSLTIPSKSLTGINVQVINIKAYSNNLITLTIFNLI